MLNTSDVKSLSKGGTTVSLEEISNSIDNKLSIDNLTGSNGIAIAKNTSGDKVEVKIGDKFNVPSNVQFQSTGAYVGFYADNGEFGLKAITSSGEQIAQPFIKGEYTANNTFNFTVQSPAGSSGVRITNTGITSWSASEGYTHNFLTEGNVKTINNQSIYGSGNISVGDKETKVVLSDQIWGSIGSTTFTIDTSVSNLQDKTITALWFCIKNAYNSDPSYHTQYSYSINITDLYNFRTSSGTQGAFSYSFQPVNVVISPVVISRANNITTSYSNGTQNYSIPLRVDFGSNPAYITVQYGFIYKGNSFAGSDVY